MRLFDGLIKASRLLAEYPYQWAICGGVAASIYRNKPRFTDDIDIALVNSSTISAEDLASKIIKTLGFKEYKGFISDTLNNNKQILGLICARGSEDEKFVGLDFLLPVQFWIQPAVEIAQSNLIDYGFDKLPTITPENLIMAKIAAVSGSPERYQDLDDIREILSSVPVDLEFLRREVEHYDLKLTPELLKLVFNK